MSRQQNSINAIIIGAGPSGIAMAHSLKFKLGFDSFTIYDKLDGAGGTWRTNTYPGCGCDVPTHLYSFSFNLNPNWSKELCDQKEILECGALTYSPSYCYFMLNINKDIEATVDKFKLRPYMHFSVECLGAKWVAEKTKWEVRFHDLQTGLKYTREASIFVSAVGGISEPRDVRFSGMEKFKGAMFHTARWDHTYDYTGKRMAVIGNGCSAAQVVPNVVNKVKYIKQFARSAQWYHERPNRNFTWLEKACFQYIPFWQRYLRLSLFNMNDNLVSTYVPGKKAEEKRRITEENAKKYIYETAPKKYHDFIIPKFPLGCKRRIFDPRYLESLHYDNLSLVAEGIKEIDETGIVSKSGIREEFDVIVLATGFQVTNFLTPMEIIGTTGGTIADQWKESRGAQAYLGTYVHNFPNFAILFGPNTFPAHNSALFTCEVQVEFTAKTLFAPIIDHRASIVEVKQDAEDHFANGVQQSLEGSVFSAGCSNWYINSAGRNSASWPGYASSFWWATFFPRFADFKFQDGEKFWMWRMVLRIGMKLLFSKYIIVPIVAMLGLLSNDFRRAFLSKA